MIRWVVILFSLLFDVHGHVRHPKDHFRPRLPPTPSPDSCDSGQADSPAQRIIGGTPGDEGAFPFMAKIVFDGGGGFCGGTLISPNYVMTAAHCAYEILETGIENVIIGLGTNRLLNCNGLWVGIDSIVMCPNYSGGTWGKDIAIAKLHRPVDYPPLIQPIHIYGGDVNFTMTMKLATVAGWGLYSMLNDTEGFHPEPSLWLLYTEVLVFDVNWCNTTWTNFDNVNIWDDEMCAGAKYRGSCLGDSGGPLMARHPSSGEWYQDGIVSFGATYYILDQGKIPSVYTRASAHCDFIEKATNGEAVCGSKMPGTPRPPSNCPVGWRPSNAVANKCYNTFEDISGNWTASFTSCSKQHKNATLVSIQNGFENSAIADEFRDRGNYWIGLNVTNGVWAWLDGQNLTYTNWANGEPSQTSGCVLVDPKTVKWSVTACEGVNVAVCEIFL